MKSRAPGDLPMNSINGGFKKPTKVQQNEYEDGPVQQDTFGSLNEDIVKFGAFAANTGQQTVEGEIYEILLEEAEVDSLNVSIDFVKIKKNSKKGILLKIKLEGILANTPNKQFE